MLTVAAKDFGPIVEGTVELRPLTVFVGPSNTGKSYLATLIYALMGLRRGAEYGQYAISFTESDLERIPAVKEAVRKWAPRVSAENSYTFSIRVPFNQAPAEVRELAESIVEGGLLSATAWLNDELRRYYGEISTLLRNTADAQLGIDLSKNRLSIRLSLGGGDNSNQLELFQKDFDLAGSVVQVDTDLKRELRRSRASNRHTSRSLERAHDFFLSTLARDTWNHTFADFPDRSYYLPAARSGIAQGHKIIASTLVRQSPFAAIRPLEVPVFSGVIADFMGHLLTMGQAGRGKRPEALQGATDFLEQRVIGGKVNLEEAELPYPEIYYETAAGKFLLRQTSAMVSELAPLILFLKYLVRPGDLLILEEPESHLHPASQRRMAQGIVRLVNAGVRVLITTHSDYFVGQLNNLLRISYASDRWLKREGFARADCLKHNDVGAYAFLWDEDAGGSRVNELTIHPDTGIDDAEFGKVANALYEEAIQVERIRPR